MTWDSKHGYEVLHHVHPVKIHQTLVTRCPQTEVEVKEEPGGQDYLQVGLVVVLVVVGLEVVVVMVVVRTVYRWGWWWWLL